MIRKLEILHDINNYIRADRELFLNNQEYQHIYG